MHSIYMGNWTVKGVYTVLKCTYCTHILEYSVLKIQLCALK